jgi:hypothetical protein
VTVKLTGETVIIMITPSSGAEPSFYQRWLRARLEAENIKVEARTPEQMTTGIEPQWIVLDDAATDAMVYEFTKECFDQEPMVVNSATQQDRINHLRAQQRSKGKRSRW